MRVVIQKLEKKLWKFLSVMAVSLKAIARKDFTFIKRRKCYTDNLECGFCESKFKVLSDLELHLRTCELYECTHCWKKGKHLTEIKKTCYGRP